MERERAINAKDILKTLWQAEKNFFAWKDRYATLSELVTSDLIDDPNNPASVYDYAVPDAGAATFKITAQRKGKTTGFQIDQDGVIAAF